MSVSHEEIVDKLNQLEERCNNGCDRKLFPAGVILAISMQTFGVVWWASGVDNTLENMNSIDETQVRNLFAEREKKYLEMDNQRHLRMSERMTKVESSFEYITRSLRRIEKKLDL